MDTPVILRPTSSTMAGKVLLVIIGGVALLLGIAGLILPLLPGILFIAIAVLCFAHGSRRVRRWLDRSPRVRPYLARWDTGAGLPLGQRLSLAWWLVLAAVGNTLRASGDRLRGRARRR